MVEVEAGTGTLIPALGEQAVLSCASKALDALAYAQQTHISYYEEYTEDLEKLGWSPSPVGGCRSYLAAAAEVVHGQYTSHVVITRGVGRGRHLVMGADGLGRELARLDETGIAAFLQGYKWDGSAR